MADVCAACRVLWCLSQKRQSHDEPIRQCTNPKISRCVAIDRASRDATVGAGYAPARLRFKVPSLMLVLIMSCLAGRHGRRRHTALIGYRAGRCGRQNEVKRGDFVTIACAGQLWETTARDGDAVQPACRHANAACHCSARSKKWVAKAFPSDGGQGHGPKAQQGRAGFRMRWSRCDGGSRALFGGVLRGCKKKRCGIGFRRMRAA